MCQRLLVRAHYTKNTLKYLLVSRKFATLGLGPPRQLRLGSRAPPEFGSWAMRRQCGFAAHAAMKMTGPWPIGASKLSALSRVEARLLHRDPAHHQAQIPPRTIGPLPACISSWLHASQTAACRCQECGPSWVSAAKSANAGTCHARLHHAIHQSPQHVSRGGAQTSWGGSERTHQA